MIDLEKLCPGQGRGGGGAEQVTIHVLTENGVSFVALPLSDDIFVVSDIFVASVLFVPGVFFVCGVICFTKYSTLNKFMADLQFHVLTEALGVAEPFWGGPTIYIC